MGMDAKEIVKRLKISGHVSQNETLQMEVNLMNSKANFSTHSVNKFLLQ